MRTSAWHEPAIRVLPHLSATGVPSTFCRPILCQPLDSTTLHEHSGPLDARAGRPGRSPGMHGQRPPMTLAPVARTASEPHHAATSTARPNRPVAGAQPCSCFAVLCVEAAVVEADPRAERLTGPPCGDSDTERAPLAPLLRVLSAWVSRVRARVPIWRVMGDSKNRPRFRRKRASRGGGQPGRHRIERERLIRGLIRRDGCQCVWCGKPLSKDGADVTVDHLVPKSVCGGTAG